MPRVSRRPLAATDILDIWYYIAEDSVNEADRWIDRLNDRRPDRIRTPQLWKLAQWRPLKDADTKHLLSVYLCRLHPSRRPHAGS